MHIDVNNAFLSWTAVLLLKKGGKIDIRNTYAIIGGDESSRHGIVLAKSMPAKKMGVVTAETIFQAKKKCPNLSIYPPNYNFYKEMSDSMFNLIRNYSPDIEPMSIDECFLDYTEVKHLYGDEVEFAYRLKKEINDKLGFTVNIGIGNNKLCAKMASDFSKPYKVHTLFPNEVKEKMWPLQVDDLFGIGKKSAIKLHNLNINTIDDLAHADGEFLYKYFKNQALDMIDRANGLGSDIVVSESAEPKGIGNELTLSKNISDYEDLYPYLLALAENVTLRLRQQDKYAYVVVVTLKDKFFKRMSHQKKLINATNMTEEVYNVSKEILREMDISNGIRLIGIRLDNLVKSSLHQVSLFENLSVREEHNKLEKTVDDLKEKYGFKVIKKASLKEKSVSKKYLGK
jgi:DNA polymerase-4